MANSLGALTVSLGLDAAEFTRGLTKSEYEAKKALDRMKADAEAMGKILGAAFAIAGAAAIKMGADFINAAADLDDLAEKTGASVEELSKLAQQARISGTDIGTVEMGLVRLAKSLNASDEESKKATKALDFLGLEASELAKMDTAQALKVVAEAMNKFGDGSGKTALALDLFGKSGAALLPFLKDMANDMELAVTVTAKQAAEAEELGKSFRRLSNDARNVGQAIALELMPFLQKTITELTEGTKAAGGFWRALLIGGSINPFASLRENLVAYKKELQGLEEGGFGEVRMARLRRAQIEFLERQQRSEALALSGSDTRGETQRFGLPGQRLPPADYRQTDDRAARAVRAARALKQEMTFDELLLKNAQKRMQQQEEMERQATKAAEDEYAARIVAEERMMQEQLKMNSRMHAEDLKAQEYFKKEIASMTEAQKAASEDVSEFWRAAYEGMQRSASDFLFNTMQGKFDDFGTRFKAMIDRMVADWLAAQALMSAGKWLGGNLGGSNSFGTSVGSIANWFGGTQAPAPVVEAIPSFVGSFAAGTDYVPRTGLALVHQGEWIGRDRDGPEGKSMTINVGPLMFQGPVDRRTADQAAAEIGERVRRAMSRNR